MSYLKTIKRALFMDALINWHFLCVVWGTPLKCLHFFLPHTRFFIILQPVSLPFFPWETDVTAEAAQVFDRITLFQIRDDGLEADDGKRVWTRSRHLCSSHVHPPGVLMCLHPLSGISHALFSIHPIAWSRVASAGSAFGTCAVDCLCSYRRAPPTARFDWSILWLVLLSLGMNLLADLLQVAQGCWSSLTWLWKYAPLTVKFLTCAPAKTCFDHVELRHLTVNENIKRNSSSKNKNLVIIPRIFTLSCGRMQYFQWNNLKLF